MAATLGARIRRARRNAGFTTADLAVRIGVVAGTVQHYEHGRRSIPAYRLDLIARACHIHISALIQDLY
jgi:transcriptional regulator with XRE-family HTH domain